MSGERAGGASGGSVGRQPGGVSNSPPGAPALDHQLDRDEQEEDRGGEDDGFTHGPGLCPTGAVRATPSVHQSCPITACL